MNKKIIIGVAVVGLLLGGTTIAAATMNQEEQPIVKVEEATNSNGSVEKEKLISVEEAKEIALSEYDGRIDSVELEYEHRTVYYEIEIEKDDDDVDVYIDAYTGEILGVDGDIDGWNINSHKDIMSLEKAKGIAVNELGGKVIEVDLDEDDGRYEYELELSTKNGEAEITIDAVTGEILELEID